MKFFEIQAVDDFRALHYAGESFCKVMIPRQLKSPSRPTYVPLEESLGFQRPKATLHPHMEDFEAGLFIQAWSEELRPLFI